MKSKDAFTLPRRLVEGGDGVAQLLRAEAHRAPGPERSFETVRAAFARRRTTRAVTLVMSCGLPLMFSALWLGTPTTNPITKEMFPDFSQEARTPALRAPNAPKKSEAAEEETRAVDEEISAVDEEASAVEVPMAPAPAQSLAPTAKSVAAPRAPLHPVSDCSSFSRSGEYSRALACFGEHALGEGTSAELALLERSRLLFHALRDTEGALSELDTYFSRFSGGALRREAGLFRIELLGRVGDGRGARSAIQALLPEVPEQEAELLSKWLDLALADGDCAEVTEVGARLTTLGKRNKQLDRRLSACE